MSFPLKRHDTLPALRVAVSDDDGYPLDLTTAISVTFSMKAYGAEDGVLKVENEPATIEDIEGGVIRYDWLAADVDTAGQFTGEFEVTSTDGKQTYPGEGEPPLRIVIGIDANNA